MINIAGLIMQQQLLIEPPLSVMVTTPTNKRKDYYDYDSPKFTDEHYNYDKIIPVLPYYDAEQTRQTLVSNYGTLTFQPIQLQAQSMPMLPKPCSPYCRVFIIINCMIFLTFTSYVIIDLMSYKGTGLVYKRFGIALLIILASWYIIMAIFLFVLEFNKRRKTDCYHIWSNNNSYMVK